MSIPKATLDQIVAELQPLLGAQIQRISQPSQEEVMWQLRCPGHTFYLLFLLAPPHERLHLVPQKPPALPTPPAFCMLLRKHLLNSRIVSISVSPDDRIVSFALQHPQGRFFFIAELIPKRANLFFCEHQREILGTCLPLTPSRQLRRGDLYIPPERPDAPASSMFANSAESVEVAENGLVLDIDEIPFPQTTLGLDIDAFPINMQVAANYEAHTERDRLQRFRQIASKARRDELKKLERLVQNLQRDFQRCEKTLQSERDAELLKPHLHQIPRGATEIEVVDYFDPNLAKRIISLDPTLSPQHNLQRLFHKIKRARKGMESIQPRLEEAEFRQLVLVEQLETIATTNDFDELQAFLSPVDVEEALQPKKRKQNQKSSPWHEFRSLDGHRIFVGKHSQGNDELTFRKARGNDLWFHARGVPGSHVLVPLERNATASSELLLDAATLAAHFSKLRNEAHVDVMHTQAKYVHKPKGAPPGKVDVMRDGNIALRMDSARLQRLLQPSSQDPEMLSANQKVNPDS